MMCQSISIHRWPSTISHNFACHSHVTIRATETSSTGKSTNMQKDVSIINFHFKNKIQQVLPDDLRCVSRNFPVLAFDLKLASGSLGEPRCSLPVGFHFLPHRMQHLLFSVESGCALFEPRNGHLHSNHVHLLHHCRGEIALKFIFFGSAQYSYPFTTGGLKECFLGTLESISLH